VSDGLKTARDSNFFARRMMRLACMLFLFLVLFAGCGIPVSRTMIIPEGIAQNPEHLIAKLDLLKTGMEVGEAFELLDIKRSTPGVPGWFHSPTNANAVATHKITAKK